MRAVTKRVWAISRLLRPWLANSATRRSLAVSESSPVRTYPAWARAGGSELGLGVLGEWSGAGAVGGVECLAEELSRFGASVASPKHGAEVGERARSFQPGVAALERVDGLTEQRRSTVTAGHDAGGAQRHAECARSAERPRELKLLFRQAFRRFVIAERELDECGL